MNSRRSIAIVKAVLLGVGLLVSLAASSRAQAQTSRSAAEGERLPPSTRIVGFVYTANERGKSISILDLRTGVVRTLPVNIAPHNVQVSRGGRLLFVVGSAPVKAADDKAADHAVTKPGGTMSGMEHIGETGRGHLLIFNAETMAPIGDITVGRETAHVVVDSHSKYAYITNSEDNDVSVVDVSRKKVIREIKTADFPHGLRISPDGREIYVACAKAGCVSVINVAAAKEVARIPVGKGPVQVGFTPNGHRAYVSLSGDNKVAVVDTVRRRRIATVPVGRNPIQVFVSPNGRFVYVANQGTKARPDDTASVISTASNRLFATIVTGRGAHGVVISSDGRRAFVANTFADTVSIIDAGTHKVIGNVNVGRGPGGITFRGLRP